MDQTNRTTYFIIAGISSNPEMDLPVFILVVLIYCVTLGGNGSIFVLICLDHHLQTPMYFFLANLSILDLCSSTTSLHKVILSFISGDNTISFTGCLAQIYIFLCFLCDQLLILTAMSYDRFVAVCNPLRYNVIMNYRVCTLLATVCWAWGFIETTETLIELTKLTCFRSNTINHFFCDLVPVMKLSCSNTLFLEIYVLVMGSVSVILIPFVLTCISYVFIISAILKIHSSTGRWKAFRTCSSHLTVVILLYTTLICQYLRPVSVDTLDSVKFFALFNTIAVPILNPLIYSLKNEEVKAAFNRLRCTL
ncbi:olfactory receptor 8G50-like [Hyperolius riggenbachi]|uniref:olfactory receptor 8G50-like n=1 Tax=Hyperolius riggenbachi TaxID=752182 RepID=UPI0035A2B3D5